MQIEFLATKKRINSFIRPDEDESVAVSTTFTEFYFKDDDVSMSNPVILLGSSNFPEVNYAILSNTESSSGGGRIYRPEKIYYWIRDIRQECNNRWTIYLKIDLLATWKTEILNNAAFIERSTSHFNSMIVDATIPLSNEIEEEIIAESDYILNPTYAGNYGTYSLQVRGLMGGTYSVAGMLSQWLLDAPNAYRLGNELNAPAFIQDLRNLFGDYMGCLVSFRFYPMGLNQFNYHQSAESVYLGNLRIPNVSAYRQQGQIAASGGVLLRLPNTVYGDFRDTAYATNYKLMLPAYGIVDISPEELIASEASALYVSWAVDILSGDIAYKIEVRNSRLSTDIPISCVSAPLAVEIPVTQWQTGSIIKPVASIVTGAAMVLGAVNIPGLGFTAAGAMKPAGYGLMAGGAAKAATGVMEGLKGTGQTVGGFSGAIAAQMQRKIQLIRIRNNTTIDPALTASTLGRPCFNIHQLKALTGFCKTRDFYLKNTGYMTLDEQEEVQNMLNTGVYITESV